MFLFVFELYGKGSTQHVISYYGARGPSLPCWQQGAIPFYCCVLFHYVNVPWPAKLFVFLEQLTPTCLPVSAQVLLPQEMVLHKHPRILFIVGFQNSMCVCFGTTTTTTGSHLQHCLGFGFLLNCGLLQGRHHVCAWLILNPLSS